jgi:hypothetical protein
MTFYIGLAVLLAVFFGLAGWAQWKRRRSESWQLQGRDHDMEGKLIEQSMRNATHPRSGNHRF